MLKIISVNITHLIYIRLKLHELCKMSTTNFTSATFFSETPCSNPKHKISFTGALFSSSWYYCPLNYILWSGLKCICHILSFIITWTHSNNHFDADSTNFHRYWLLVAAILNILASPIYFFLLQKFPQIS